MLFVHLSGKKFIDMQIPTINELYNDIINDLESEYSINIPGFGKVFLRALAMVQAGKLFILYTIAAKIYRNIAPDTAETAFNDGTLERWGRIKLNRNPNPAKSGKYNINVTGQAGTVIPGSTTWKSDDSATNSGILYVLDNDYTLGGSGTVTEQVEVRALTAGPDGKQVAGDTMTLTSPIANVEDQADVASETQTPVEAEKLEGYRRKVLESFRIESQGGASADFRLWSFDADGVRTSYPFTLVSDPTNTKVEVFVEALPGDTASGQPQGTPPSSMLTEVEDVIRKNPDTSLPDYKRGRMPLPGFNLDVKAVDVLNVDITINNYQDPGNHQQQIEDAIEARLYDTRPFVAAIDSEDSRQDVFNLNNIIFEIQNINPRIRLGTVQLDVGSQTNINSYQFGVDQQNGIRGEIPVLNSITFA